MANKQNEDKPKKIKFAGFWIREIERKSCKAYQVDLGQRNGKHTRRSFQTMTEAKRYAQLVRSEDKAIIHGGCPYTRGLPSASYW